MQDYLPILFILLNCCVAPVAFMYIGYALGRGYRLRIETPHDHQSNNLPSELDYE